MSQYCQKCNRYQSTMHWTRCESCGAVNLEVFPHTPPILAQALEPRPILVEDDTSDFSKSAIVVVDSSSAELRGGGAHGKLLALLPPQPYGGEWRLVLRGPLDSALEAVKKERDAARAETAETRAELATFTTSSEAAAKAAKERLEGNAAMIASMTRSVDEALVREKAAQVTCRKLEADLAKVRTAIGTKAFGDILVPKENSNA